jgi:hypothetical protein
VDAHGMPIRIFITDGTTADCTQASKQGINAEFLLADKGYDSDEIIKQEQKLESPKRIRQIYTS